MTAFQDRDLIDGRLPRSGDLKQYSGIRSGSFYKNARQANNAHLGLGAERLLFIAGCGTSVAPTRKIKSRTRPDSNSGGDGIRAFSCTVICVRWRMP